MVETTPQLAEIIQRYRRELEKMNIRCERIWLFGSQVDGTAHEGSDIDLIVVSPDLTFYDQRTRLERLGVAAGRILEPIQAQGLTPEEITSHRMSPFIEYVINELAIDVTHYAGEAVGSHP
ncbi:nucleotidyltransferase domain-containing protein [Candidatus Amarolinea dominans]|uniref:nucleotidyltransferase domain-containing protein n=1 Tax=Candidatus Amarolinea dominans TaxID=3140696 RepID=UPI001D9A4C59|nr:nucleotidyltransferase domain-containing protein [Anaerolineae bacterium]MBK7202893.1 nucleotidyltransferase domain-containing protein [Anaerolineae bacterium]